ncbi:DUF1999 domain-containing protein [Deinococcus peraridilitoris]|uniref:N-acetyltransferase domain-containing protein n=1 Tax=Deinococcus peraridilitoris (strain DSM 19664 / LMG 22246 / CIP 109416 / KR-200) TaxID=937777 RepID=L0A302_DEIPD|nr:DUF1999 domain-containing protein [Deinococcus peraridilitoris]AFZ67824.1 Protein of unknown function (DUF1999) [Deinococcus peraridilitoris DSM 19664]
MLYRAFTPADFGPLVDLDLTVLRREDPLFDTLSEREREGRVRTSLAALRFYERSEHSFVAEEDGELRGAIFAQSVWQGDRPTVLVTRLWLARPADADVTSGLLRACSKSAYDAAIYELHLGVTAELQEGAAREHFREQGVYAVRLLGSRADSAPGREMKRHHES